MRNTFVTNGYAGSLSQIRSKSHTDLTENTDLETITITITITRAAVMPPLLFFERQFPEIYRKSSRQLSVEKHEGLFAIRLMFEQKGRN